MKAKFEFFRFRFHFQGSGRGPLPRRQERQRDSRRFRADPARHRVARGLRPPVRAGQPTGASSQRLRRLAAAFHFAGRTTLDGRTVPQGGRFCFDVHIFDLRPAVLSLFPRGIRAVRRPGDRSRHGRVALSGPSRWIWRTRPDPCRERRAAGHRSRRRPGAGGSRVGVRFLSPTELKSEGPWLRGRNLRFFSPGCATASARCGRYTAPARWRSISAAMGERAAAIRMSRCDVQWEKVERKSGRTGQVHPLGGFTGSAEYEGELAEFLPWLRAARGWGWAGRRCGARGMCGWYRENRGKGCHPVTLRVTLG